MLKKKTIWQVARVLVSLLILATLLVFTDLKGIYLTLRSVALWPLAAVVLLLFPSMVLRGYRWKLLFDNPDHRISFMDSMRLLFAGMALNLVLPATAGDIAKSYFGYKWSGVKERMISISLLDKLIGLASVGVLGIPFALYNGYSGYALLSSVTLVPLAGLWAVSRFKKMPAPLSAFAERMQRRLDLAAVVKEAGVGPVLFLAALLISVAGWLLTYLQLYYCFRAVGQAVPVYYIFSVAPLLTLVRLFPFTLNGLGSDEAAIVVLFGQLGFTSVGHESALASGLLYRFILLLIPGLIGLMVIAVLKRFQNGTGSIVQGG